LPKLPSKGDCATGNQGTARREFRESVRQRLGQLGIAIECLDDDDRARRINETLDKLYKEL